MNHTDKFIAATYLINSGHTKHATPLAAALPSALRYGALCGNPPASASDKLIAAVGLLKTANQLGPDVDGWDKLIAGGSAVAGLGAMGRGAYNTSKLVNKAVGREFNRLGQRYAVGGELTGLMKHSPELANIAGRRLGKVSQSALGRGLMKNKLGLGLGAAATAFGLGKGLRDSGKASGYHEAGRELVPTTLGLMQRDLQNTNGGYFGNLMAALAGNGGNTQAVNQIGAQLQQLMQASKK
jgi:hypothetical protein